MLPLNTTKTALFFRLIVVLTSSQKVETYYYYYYYGDAENNYNHIQIVHYVSSKFGALPELWETQNVPQEVRGAKQCSSQL